MSIKPERRKFTPPTLFRVGVLNTIGESDMLLSIPVEVSAKAPIHGPTVTVKSEFSAFENVHMKLDAACNVQLDVRTFLEVCLVLS